MNLKANLLKKVSKKGNEFYCIEIQFTDTYKKVVFLEPVELELLKATGLLSSLSADFDFDNLD